MSNPKNIMVFLCSSILLCLSNLSYTQMVITNSSSDEVLRVTNNGDVGIGTSNPTAQLHSTGTVRFSYLSGNNAGNHALVSVDGEGNLFRFNGNSILEGRYTLTNAQDIPFSAFDFYPVLYDLVIQEDFSPSILNPATGDITIPEDGFYYICGQARIDFAGHRALAIFINNVLYDHVLDNAYIGEGEILTITLLGKLSAGTILSVRFKNQADDETLHPLFPQYHQTHLDVIKIF